MFLFSKSLFLNLVLLLFICVTSPVAESEIKIEKLKLKQKENLTFRYGSGLAFKNSNSYGSSMFYLFPGGEYLITNGRDVRENQDIPHIAVGKLRKKKFKIKERFPIFFANDTSLNVDLEGIATAPEKTVWMADERNNSLLKVSLETGIVEDLVKPGDGLPEYLKLAIPNRGLESVAVTPNHKVYTVLQSIMHLPNGDYADQEFIRLIEFNPASRTSRTLALPIELDDYADPAEIKIGGLQAIDQKRFLMIEQGLSRNYKDINRVFIININGASDISDISSEDISKAANAGNLFGKDNLIPYPIRKELLVDLNQHGWELRKAEGLALMNPNQFAIINDWDDDVSRNELWIFTLPEPLLTWTWLEWAIFWILIFIFALSTVITFIMVFKKPADE